VTISRVYLVVRINFAHHNVDEVPVGKLYVRLELRRLEVVERWILRAAAPIVGFLTCLFEQKLPGGRLGNRSRKVVFRK
jgi:hypothetical protein